MSLERSLIHLAASRFWCKLHGANSAVTALAVRTGCLVPVLDFLRVSQSSGIFSVVVSKLIKLYTCIYSSSVLCFGIKQCRQDWFNTEIRALSSFVFTVIDLLSSAGSESPARSWSNTLVALHFWDKLWNTSRCLRQAVPFLSSFCIWCLTQALGVTTKQWNLTVTQIGQAAQLQNMSLYLTLCSHLLPRAGASCKMRKRESSLRGRYVSPTLTDKTPLVKIKLFYGQQTSTWN